MNEPYHDPNIEKLYNDLLKLNLKSLTPAESSETWEVIKFLYKKERRKRWRKVLIRLGLALSASAAVGAIVYKVKQPGTGKPSRS